MVSCWDTGVLLCALLGGLLLTGSAVSSDLPDIQSLFPEGLAGSAGVPPEQRLRGCLRGCPGAGRCWALTAT
ncbi:hypothetical protein E5288_WYG005326 [Bos mutus]|uniref:Uncharacterized protein n=1 Tax=Bos mutus TaxID=72004 RepID=A0A6B0S8N5_9CETA|nr:hypothetical protein [Bos mutus]